MESKFNMTISNVQFLLANYKGSLDAAVMGIECIDKIVSMDPEIIASMRNVTRDLNNNKIRSIAKI